MIVKVAIDGPAGAGKSTVAKKVAQQLNIPYVDSGAIYRSLTWFALQKGLMLNQENALADLAATLDVQFVLDGDGQRVIVHGKDVTNEIRGHEITSQVSMVAAHPFVRENLLKLQKSLADNSLGVVMDGRDIGSRILPNADVKVFLTASLQVRSKRRWEELKCQGITMEFEDLKRQLEQRDAADKSREASPLKQADDAVVLDTTLLTAQEAAAMIVTLCEIRVKNRGIISKG